MDDSSRISDVLVGALFFPHFFQRQLIQFVWGAQDPAWLMLLKRTFLLLPACALLVCLWTAILNLLSILVRTRRREFAMAFLVTWWDLGKAVFAFWGGVLRFLIVFVGAVYTLVRVLVVGVWLLLLDILLSPVRLVQVVGRNIAAPRLPWFALVLTVLWCLLEAVVFTYVMTPLVLDTLSNLTGQTLSERLVRIPLFLFLLLLALGSYAVLAAWAGAFKSRNVPAMVRITAVELVAAMVEVLFLYREFVDALVPWFAQHAAQGFEPGVVGTLSIACLAWIGVRGMTWFLFASSGIPILTAIISGAGLGAPQEMGVAKARIATYVGTLYGRIRSDMNWLSQKGEEVLAAFLLPPLQVIAATLNHLALLVTARHVFDLPFKNLKDVMEFSPVMPIQPKAPRGES